MLTVTNTHSLTFPSSWQEVTLGQFLAIADAGDSRTLLESLASDVAQLRVLPSGIESQLIAALSFLSNVPAFDTLPVPAAIGGIVPPKYANLCPLIMKWCLEEWEKDIGESGKNTASYLVMAVPVLSIYLCPELTGELFTDLEQAYSLRDRIMALPAIDALPLAAFFLSSYQNPTSLGRHSFNISYHEVPKNGWLPTWCQSLRFSLSSAHLVPWRKPGR